MHCLIIQLHSHYNAIAEFSIVYVPHFSTRTRLGYVFAAISMVV